LLNPKLKINDKVNSKEKTFLNNKKIFKNIRTFEIFLNIYINTVKIKNKIAFRSHIWYIL